MPFYVSPEQLMKDRADFARKGIARGRSVVVAQYDRRHRLRRREPSRTLHKVSEIYDRIGFAAVGKYNEFENLRVAGSRYADLRGYSYDRSDVTAPGLANAYAQTLGTVFTQESKPYEVEIVVAEVGVTRTPTSSTGSPTTGRSPTSGVRRHGRRCGAHRGGTRGAGARVAPSEAVAPGRRPAGHAIRPGEPARELTGDQLEVAVLDRQPATTDLPTPRWRRPERAADSGS
jgi:proteasome alpha subunit